VRTAFIAAAFRAAGERCRAALLACRANAACEAAVRPCRFNARLAARDRRGAGFCLRPAVAPREAYLADFLVEAFEPAGGGGSFTPARRAFESPIAIACLVELAPCFPSRM
jgi:hypothetical protein